MSIARGGLLVLDVDGMLTDGSLYCGSLGEEAKRFHSLDGVAARRAGLTLAVISRLGVDIGRPANEQTRGRRGLSVGVEAPAQGEGSMAT